MCISSALSTHINSDVDSALSDFCLTGAQRFAIAALQRSIVKKFEDRSKAADKAAIALFLTVNERMAQFKAPTFGWEDPRAELHSSLKLLLWKILDGSKRITPPEVLESMKVGPGASVGVTGGSLFEKLATGRLASTDQRLTQLWFAANKQFGYVQQCEVIRNAEFGPPVCVDSSTLTCVPKNRDISRTICTEPPVNMMFQQGIKAALENRLKRHFGIDLENQQVKNKLLAQRGSLNGQLATIDLSSASDSLSLDMVRSYFPKGIVDWLEFTRSPSTKLPSGEVVPLNMISSMGNAYTFPLQTILFAAVVEVVYRHLDIPVIRPRGRLIGNFGVNGDDIIVDIRAFQTVVNMLSELGFIVNHEKTFSDGNFRESCGGDYYNGHDVRGVYARKLDTLQDIYSLVNRLNAWSMKHEIALPLTVGYLLSLIKSDKMRYFYVPLDESDTAGIKVPYKYARPKVVLNRTTGAIGFSYERFVARSVGFSVPTDSIYGYAIASQILYGGAESRKRLERDGSTSDIVYISCRPKGAICYDKRSVITPRWDYEEMTSRYCFGKIPSGLPRKWNFAVQNLGMR